MKKGIILSFVCMALLLLFSGMVSGQESEDRTGSIIIKAGIIIPTEDQDNRLGGANFTVEGEYVLYSTEYLDFSGIFGYYRTGINNPLPLTNSFNFKDFSTIYYMGGVKLYPAKKGFYICGYVGGATTYVNGDILTCGTFQRVIDDSFSGFAIKTGIGADIGENFVIEAAYIVQDSEDLVILLNGSKVPNTHNFRNNGGIQIMGGYKF